MIGFRYYTAFEIADVTIELQINHPLEVDEAFEPFQVSRYTDPIVVEFQELERMDFPKEDPMFSNISFRVYRNPDGNGYFRVYHDHKEEDRPYAISHMLDEHQEKIQYLADSRLFFSGSQNTFSHIGLEWLLLRQEAMILHAAFVDTERGGLLFSGPSGIGKSTQAELWRRSRGAAIINGDRTILRKREGSWRAYGSPYAGSSKYFVNASTDIRAILILQQGQTCQIQGMDPRAAFARLYAQMIVNYWETWYVERLTSLIMDLLEKVPVYLFRCTPGEEAVEFLDTFLKEEAVHESGRSTL